MFVQIECADMRKLRPDFGRTPTPKSQNIYRRRFPENQQRLRCRDLSWVKKTAKLLRTRYAPTLHKRVGTMANRAIYSVPPLPACHSKRSSCLAVS